MLLPPLRAELIFPSQGPGHWRYKISSWPLSLAHPYQWAFLGYNAPGLGGPELGQAAFPEQKKNNGLQNGPFVLTIGAVPFPTPNL